MTSAMKTRTQTSAGGVAYRNAGGAYEIAIVLMEPERRWQLPKGLIDPGETPEQAALREVREEAGIECTIVAPIDTIDYWFVDERGGEKVRVHKFVHFFLMRYKGGSTDEHDHEVAEARWAEVSEAIRMLAFDSEKSVVLLGSDMIGSKEISL